MEVLLNLLKQISQIKSLQFPFLGADYGDYDDSQKSKTPVASKPHISDEEEYFNRTQEKVYETIYNACDKRIELYVLNQTQFIQGRGYNYRNEPGCAR